MLYSQFCTFAAFVRKNFNFPVPDGRFNWIFLIAGRTGKESMLARALSDSTDYGSQES